MSEGTCPKCGHPLGIGGVCHLCEVQATLQKQGDVRPCVSCGEPTPLNSILSTLPDITLCEKCARVAEERLARAVFGDAVVDRHLAKKKEGDK